ncbi:hypothetical protein JNW90_13655 [Micromonospora sp. STR1s_5]|nr:hypothetical protein [Micromonospora sp. STR1s_5]
MSLSNYAENKVLRALFMGETFTGPATHYVALFTVSPGETGASGIEVSGGSYARVAVTASTGFNVTGTSPTQVTNATEIAFPTASAPWGLVVSAGCYDAPSGGNLIHYGTLSVPAPVQTAGLLPVPPRRLQGDDRLMAKLFDRVGVITTTEGTDTVTLGAALDDAVMGGLVTFADAGAQDGDEVNYLITDGNAWEIGTGTYDSTGPTLTRGFTKSSTGNLLNLSGTAKVFSTVLASDLNALAPLDEPNFTGLVRYGTFMFQGEIEGDYFQTINAQWDPDTSTWNRVNTAYPAFMWRTNLQNLMIGEVYRSMTLWTAQPGANPIGAYTNEGGWLMVQSVSEYKDVTYGGNGFEIDGNSGPPYGRYRHAHYADTTKTGILTNLYLDESGRDSADNNSWSAGIVANSSVEAFRVQMAPAGGNTAVWSDLLVLDASGNLTNKNNIKGRDVTADRGDGTGVIYLGNSASRYLFYDGGNYTMPGANLWVNGSPVELTSNKGVANGYAGLDADGKVPSSLLPDTDVVVTENKVFQAEPEPAPTLDDTRAILVHTKQVFDTADGPITLTGAPGPLPRPALIRRTNGKSRGFFGTANPQQMAGPTLH